MDSTDVDLPNRRWTRVRPPFGRDDEDGGRQTTPSWLSDSADSSSVLVADARLAEGTLALAQSLGSIPNATFVPDHHTVSSSGTRTLYTSVTGASRNRFESAFSMDESVETADHVETFPDCHLYRLDLSADAVLVAPTSVELGARTLRVQGTDGAWNVRLQFPDRDAVVALRQFCEDAGIRFAIDRLLKTDWVTDGPSALTDQQWETLRLALESGYFEVPREVTQDDLASMLDISTSAVSHRLRRATAGLVQDALGGMEDRS